jgi:hypothetical protein
MVFFNLGHRVVTVLAETQLSLPDIWVANSLREDAILHRTLANLPITGAVTACD